YINELKKEDLENKKVLLRVDFDISILDGKIAENFRIKAQKETVDYLISAGAKVLMVGHLGHDVSSLSFTPIVEELGEILGQTLTLVPHSELGEVNKLFEVSQFLLLDNIRQDSRETENDDGFAAELAKGFNYYVNDAFAVMHREHASVVAITKHLPSYAGFLIKKEIENLEQAMKAPAEGKILVLGGAKISTKLPVIKNFLKKAEKILIGGALANNFFQAQGINVGASVVDGRVKPDVNSDKIILPQDVLIADDKTGGSGAEISLVKDIDPNQAILDIGPETVKQYAKIIKGAKMVIWNGPVGLSEIDAFAEGTHVVAKAVASMERSIIGGGDTIAAVNKLGLLDRYSFISTGGGAMLEFLASNKLPGLEALDL
ncbi:MAG: phosphoglycerate kinase, partial [Candidatus Buchananbacteria bacterium]|nr:phosphoglycerate kinase [Candidatus Buchananbacteria bacterium]